MASARAAAPPPGSFWIIRRSLIVGLIDKTYRFDSPAPKQRAHNACISRAVECGAKLRLRCPRKLAVPELGSYSGGVPTTNWIAGVLRSYLVALDFECFLTLTELELS